MKIINEGGNRKYEYSKISSESGLATLPRQAGKDPSSSKRKYVICHTTEVYVHYRRTRLPAHPGQHSGKRHGSHGVPWLVHNAQRYSGWYLST